MTSEPLLLIEEDAQDYLKIRRLLDDPGSKFSIDWAPNYDSAFKLVRKNNYQICLIGYYPKHLEQQKFLAQLYSFVTIPTILLTKPGEEDINSDWLDKFDCLAKEQLNWSQLERSRRHLSQLLSLQQSEQKLQAILENACEFIGLVDSQGVLIEINQTALTFFGLKREEMIDRPIWETSWVSVSSKYQAKLKIAVARCAKGEWVHYEMEVQGGAGQVISLECSLKPMRIRGNLILLFEGRDVKSRNLPDGQTNQNDLLDYLTGFPNRQAFMEHLERAMNEVQRRKDYHVAVLFVDLDRFRVINASLGHDMGDWLLMEIAHRLRACLKEPDLLARSGGDEFLILLENMQDLNEAIRIAKNINEAVARPFWLDGGEIITSASIGIAYSTHQEVAHIDLLRDVDTAMYKAKAMGKSCYAVFHREMHVQAVSRLQIEMDLHHAVEQNHFVLFYQPQTVLASDELIGVEALIRLCHPQHGLMSPVDFLPVLEDTGIIVTLGEWILKTACAQLKTWLDTGLLLDHVAVNLSAHQFRYKRLNEFVAECLDITGLSPESLELEITETLLLEDTASAVKMLTQFRDMGIRVTIDDFGTGYASLNYLKRFPADALKIDRSFIQGVTSAPKDAAITVATIDMAHALGLTVVAEGVETADQRDFLRDHGCDWAQGFFYAAPMEESALLPWALQYNRMVKTNRN